MHFERQNKIARGVVQETCLLKIVFEIIAAAFIRIKVYPKRREGPITLY